MNLRHDPFRNISRADGMPNDSRWEAPPRSHDRDAGESQSAPACFRFVAVGDLEYRPPEFLVEDLIETDGLGLLFGDPGCGKSFLAADLALSVACGHEFHGKGVKQGAVFYIAGEGHNGLVRRFTAWAKHTGCDLKGVPMFKSERAAQFLDTASARAVTAAVKAMEASYGPPALIVVDTLARNFGAGDENATQEMNQFIAIMDQLRANWPGCVILIVHHSGHGDKGRARGSIALKGALDFEYRLEKDQLSLTLTNTKMKDAPEPAPMGFALHQVEIAPGVSSAVLIDAEAIPKKAKITGQAKVALQAFGDAIAHHGENKHGDMFPGNRQCVSLEHWRNYCIRHSLSSGASESAQRKAFHTAKNTLQEKGVICVVDDYAWRVE